MQVQKRDGRLENFDRSKLENSYLSAGLDDAGAADLALEIESWAMEEAVDEVIESQALWEKSVSALEEIDPEAAQRYRDYRN